MQLKLNIKVWRAILWNLNFWTDRQVELWSFDFHESNKIPGTLFNKKEITITSILNFLLFDQTVWRMSKTSHIFNFCTLVFSTHFWNEITDSFGETLNRGQAGMILLHHLFLHWHCSYYCSCWRQEGGHRNCLRRSGETVPGLRGPLTRHWGRSLGPTYTASDTMTP